MIYKFLKYKDRPARTQYQAVRMYANGYTFSFSDPESNRVLLEFWCADFYRGVKIFEFQMQPAKEGTKGHPNLPNGFSYKGSVLPLQRPGLYSVLNQAM